MSDKNRFLIHKAIYILYDLKFEMKDDSTLNDFIKHLNKVIISTSTTHDINSLLKEAKWVVDNWKGIKSLYDFLIKENNDNYQLFKFHEFDLENKIFDSIIISDIIKQEGLDSFLFSSTKENSKLALMYLGNDEYKLNDYTFTCLTNGRNTEILIKSNEKIINKIYFANDKIKQEIPTNFDIEKVKGSNLTINFFDKKGNKNAHMDLLKNPEIKSNTSHLKYNPLFKLTQEEKETLLVLSIATFLFISFSSYHDFHIPRNFKRTKIKSK